MKARVAAFGLFVVVVVCSAACTKRGAPMSRTRVVVSGANVAADVAAVEAALVAGGDVRSVVCADHAVVVANDAAGVDAAAVVNAARLSAPAQVSREEDPVVVFTVTGHDAVGARTVVDTRLRAALAQVPGFRALQARGGKTGRRVELDLAQLLARDVTVGEAVAVVGGPASLETMVVKTVSAAPPSLTLVKTAPPPAQPGDVKLTDVARVGTLPVGEPLRRDGAVEVRVFGDADKKDAIVAAARAVAQEQGVVLAVLDDDNVEALDVIVPAGVDRDDVHRAIAAIPGLRVQDDDTAVAVRVDDSKVKAVGLRKDDVDRVVAVGTGGLTVLRNTENVVVVLQGAVSPELLSQLVVARTPAGAVRLYDVATVEIVPARRERWNGRPAARLAVTLEPGVRKNALAALAERVAAFPGVVVDRRGVSCD